MPSLLRQVLLLPTSLLAITLSHALAAHIPSLQSRDNEPSAISIAPSEQWDGIDGSWSSFTVRIGTPPQDVRTFVSWNSPQTWAVIPQGCQAAADYNACAQSRGGVFNEKDSSTWEQQGLYSLRILEDLGYDGNGYFGYDVVGLSKNGPSLQNTTVAGFALEDFWLGVLGINPAPTNYSNTDTATSYMSLLKEQKHIPSISFGYTAGAQYRSGSTSDAYGSLTLGGYDDDKFVANDLTWKFGLGEIGDTVVALQSVNTPSDVKSSPIATEMLPKPIYISLDATVPHIWLPIESCYVFEYEFGLVYDNTTDLYLVNNSHHETLLARNASITFQIALGTSDNEENISIQLPYAAFDLTAQPPYQGLSNDSYYFPLRRAANESQYTLGRTFFQEAYIAVDYESQTFNVSQRQWSDSSSQNLITIPPFSAKSSSYPGVGASTTSSSHGLSGGAIAGIVVGIIALLAIAILWLVRRRKQARHAALENEKLGSGSDAGSDVDGSVVARTAGSESIVIPKAELPGSAPLSHHDSDEHALLASGALSTALSTHGSSSPSETRSPCSANHLSGATFVNGRWTPGENFSDSGDVEEGTGTHSSTESSSRGTGAHSNSNYGGTGSGTLMSLVSPLSPTDSHEADGTERHVYEMAGDMPTVKEKDGKELSEKEAMAHREKVYNGVDAPPVSPMETRSAATTAGNSGAAQTASRRQEVRPEDVVRARPGTAAGAGALEVPKESDGRPGTRHRAFSFEERREGRASEEEELFR